MGPIVTLLLFTVRQTLLTRKVWLTLLILAGPAVLGALIRGVAVPPEAGRGIWELYHVLAQVMLLSLLVPLVCMVHGVALMAGDVDARTIGYLTTRRLRRATVLIVKFVATALVLAVLCDAAMLAVHLAALAGLSLPDEPAALGWNPPGELRHYLLIVPVAVAAFLAVFTLIGLVVKRPLAVSAMYLVGVELIMSNIPAPITWYTLSYYLRALAVRAMPGLHDLYELPPDLRELLYPPGAAIWPVLAAVVVVALVLSGWLVTARELVTAKVVRE